MFVQIPDFPMYLVDGHGVVVSLKRGQWKVLKPWHISGGYLGVGLYKDGKTQTKKVHRLVMAAWKGKSELTVNHIDGVKTNNRLENLEYVTDAENKSKAWADGLITPRKGEQHGHAILSDKQASNLLALKGKMKQREAAAKFGVSQSLVSSIWTRRSWKHLKENK